MPILTVFKVGNKIYYMSHNISFATYKHREVAYLSHNYILSFILNALFCSIITYHPFLKDTLLYSCRFAISCSSYIY